MYRQIALRLRDEIAAGLFEPSGRLPTEAEIGSRFAVSRVTVRMALDLLETDGLIVRHKGKGTFTADKRMRHPLDTLRSFHESLKLQGLNASICHIQADLTATPRALRDQFGKQCLVAVRLHLVDNNPVALGRNILPSALAGYDWGNAQHTPLYSILADVTGKPISGADVEVKATAAEGDTATLLDVRPGTPLLVMDRRSYFADQSTAVQSTFFIRPERYSFVLSHRWGG
jgi:GntR family transcriptional regulator